MVQVLKEYMVPSTDRASQAHKIFHTYMHAYIHVNVVQVVQVIMLEIPIINR